MPSLMKMLQLNLQFSNKILVQVKYKSRKYGWGPKHKWVSTSRNPYVIKDGNLRSSLKNTEGASSQYDMKIYNIRTIDSKNKNIIDDTGLKYLKYLSNINIDENMVEDLSDFSNLKALKYLSLNGNNINNISPLRYLPLRRLSIKRNAFYTPEQIELAKDVIEELESRGCTVYHDLK